MYTSVDEVCRVFASICRDIYNTPSPSLEAILRSVSAFKGARRSLNVLLASQDYEIADFEQENPALNTSVLWFKRALASETLAEQDWNLGHAEMGLELAVDIEEFKRSTQGS